MMKLVSNHHIKIIEYVEKTVLEEYYGFVIPAKNDYVYVDKQRYQVYFIEHHFYSESKTGYNDYINVVVEEVKL